ncbi:MAG: type II secretion system F family protein [Candidatus Lloydbacteria bacterium]|nr:type II secretion system F family protein [Candidatus Lloydbacteria bacterium]
MLFNYTAITKEGEPRKGAIDAFNEDAAIASLQRRDLVITSISETKTGPWWKSAMPFLDSVSQKDVVILSRQIATLFEAKVPALEIFKLLANESDNETLRKILATITDDIQSGISISQAMEKHLNVFSNFYVSMVRSGEESGKLNETFLYLAEHLDRSYALSSKAKNALIYPAFVISTFFIVMVVMFVMVIPRLSAILTETGQSIPLYTKVVIGISNFLVQYGLFFFLMLVVGGVFLWRYWIGRGGEAVLSRLEISLPFIGRLYRKFYLARIATNLDTMLTSGIPIVRAIEVTAAVVGNKVYENILKKTATSVQAGDTLSQALGAYGEIPSILTQMVKVGEETGKLGYVLKTLSVFYEREVNNEVDTIVSLIEPILIVLLGIGVGLLLAAVLVPIYQTTSGL